MEKFNALEKEWTKMLTSGEDVAVLTALHQIRNSGSVRMLPHVIRLLTNKPDKKLSGQILQFLGEIRSQEAVPVLAEWLDIMEKTPFFAAYLSACWQSGLDFSAHITYIAKIFVKSDYQTSVEAYTLIEESLHLASGDIRTDCLKQLRDAREKIAHEKYPLYLELLETIQNAKAPGRML